MSHRICSDPCSDRKLAANRANARCSTGPTSAAGKARSGRNALRHGLYAKDVAIGYWERNDYRSFADAVVRDLNPRDTLEFVQAERIAALQWRIGRVQRAETTLILDERKDLFDFNRDRYDRLEEQRVRDQKLPPERRECQPCEAREIELVSLMHVSSDDIDPVDALASLARCEDAPALDRLGRMEQRLDTQLQRAWKQMRLLQDPDRDIGAPATAMVESMERRGPSAVADAGAATAEPLPGSSNEPATDERATDEPSADPVPEVSEDAAAPEITPARNEPTHCATAVNTATCKGQADFPGTAPAAVHGPAATAAAPTPSPREGRGQG